MGRVRQGRDGRTMTLWVEGMNPTRKEQGAGILYDEPDHAFSHTDTSTWPPKLVDLSSFWVLKIVTNRHIPHSTRYTHWPNTFSSMKGLQASWKNKGKAPRVFDVEKATWNYPIIFNTLQLHGEEGERALLDATEMITGKPHNKHIFTIGKVCVSNDNPFLSPEVFQADTGTHIKSLLNSSPIPASLVNGQISSPPQGPSLAMATELYTSRTGVDDVVAPFQEDAFEEAEPLGSVPSVQEESPEAFSVSQSGTDSESEDDNGFSSKIKLLIRQGIELGKMRKELATAREEVKANLDNTLQLENNLSIADGKVMVMTTVLNSCFNMLFQLSKSLQSCATLAKTFLKEHGKMTEEEQERFEHIKRESDQVSESTTMAISSVQGVIDQFDYLETCFPRSKRIFADSQGIRDWCAERALVGGKAVEEGDLQVNDEGEMVGKGDDGSQEL